jgi:hypothetical protein
MVSTPNAPNGLFDKIEREPEELCIYKRLKMDYTYGLNRIYTKEEIDKAKKSPSFDREYDLQYLGLIGNTFHTADIERAIVLGKKYRTTNTYAQKSNGDRPKIWFLSFGYCYYPIQWWPDIAELFAAALQTGGLKTVVTDEASVAVGKIKDNPDEYSLVLIDRSSQQDSDFPKQVKRINDQIKVLLASGFAFNDVEISNSRYDRILQLPITMSKLVSTVKELLSS